MQQLADWLANYGIHRREILIACGVLLAAALAIQVFRSWRKRRRRPAQAADPKLQLDVSELPQDAPGPTGARLEFYNIPVRLAGVIVAPAGRASELPVADDILWHVLENAIPQLSRVAEDHTPAVVHWPTQLSDSGFARAVFRNLTMPGLHGDGRRTLWSVAAGHVSAGEQSIAVALIVRAESPNSFGQEVARHESDWRRMFRVLTT